jgi:cobalt-zinc-cadmium efflux system outer membrane protein
MLGHSPFLRFVRPRGLSWHSWHRFCRRGGDLSILISPGSFRSRIDGSPRLIFRAPLVTPRIEPASTERARRALATSLTCKRRRRGARELNTIATDMKLHVALPALALSLSHAAVGYGQLVGLADDIIVISKGANSRASARENTELRQTAGPGMEPLTYNPSGRSDRLSDAAEPARSRYVPGHNRSLLSATARPASALRPSRLAIRPQRPAAHPPSVPPLHGLLEIPLGEAEGPRQGMTLDEAIDRLLHESPDLRAKRYEIPQARADVLTAGLRANPLYFISANNLPYRPYSPGRFGAVQYSPSFVQPFDVNDKRAARVESASQALRVLEAQYQNAVRLAVHELYLSYTDVIVARETLRYAEVSLTGTKMMFDASRAQGAEDSPSESDRLHLAIQYETARLEVDQARSGLLHAKHRLGAKLAIPRERAAHLQVRGNLRPPEPALAGRNELLQLALSTRPDVQAFRLGIGRARADVRLARKERIDDVFLVYSPFVFQNNVPIGKQNVTSFSLGVMGSIPIFDRKQGEILRAETNVAQSRAALEAMQREVAAEVESALVELFASREAVERIENAILPASERAREIAYREHAAGRRSTFEYLLALRDRNDVVRQYRDALIRHRRSMLQLNTSVGRRLLP